MVDWTKVDAHLISIMEDPFNKDAARILALRIRANKPGVGEILRNLIERIEGDLAYIIYGVHHLDECDLFGVSLPVAMSRLRLIE